MQQIKLISSFDYLEPLVSGSRNREWYYEDDNNKDELLISVGDSWTWGMSLGKIAHGEVDDKNYRTRNIYGYHLSKLFDSDFINIGIPGGANLKILDHLRIVLKNLSKEYKRINIVFTLTESARDLNSLDLVNKEYENLRDSSWPLLKELPYQDSATIAFILNDSFIMPQWTDIISRDGNISEYPKELYCLSHSMGFQLINNVINKYSLNIKNYKDKLLLHMSRADVAINWFRQSPYNSKVTIQHPLEDAHKWWADEVYKKFTVH